jgi:hypothetical protein
LINVFIAAAFPYPVNDDEKQGGEKDYPVGYAHLSIKVISCPVIIKKISQAMTIK